MDASQYLPMFLAEAREHLQELNLAVVRLEEAPEDRETIDEIFRIAHSLKGMSATMGFQAIASVTHEMEDVLEIVRQRHGAIEPEIVNVVLECLDAFEGAIASIETDGVEQLDAEPLVERLRALVRAEDEGESAEEVEPFALEEIEGRVLHVKVTLVGDALMPGVRAFQVLEALSDHGRIVRSAPNQRGIESFSGHEIEAWLETEHPAETLERSALSVSDVASALARDPSSGDDVSRSPAREETRTGAPAAAKSSGTVRIDAERLDQLMHLMGELVVHRTRLESLVAEADVPGLGQAMQDLTRTSHALQTMVMQVRMIPVDAVFLRFPRLVRDLSTKLGKQVELVLEGQETELDRTVVEALGDPLVHLVRNALDHGLEQPEERAARGKPATGTLEIAARHVGGNVVISVRDDGHGIDPDHVARKAADRGLIPPEAIASIDVPRAIELLFTPGFSTADQTSDISGRGVGLDAVRALIRGLGGEVLIDSETGAGTTARIRLPLTLAIMSALLVEAGGEPFAIPLDRVERTLPLHAYPIRSIAGRRMLVLKDSALPLLDGGASLGCANCGSDCSHAVIVRAGDHRLAVAVQRLVGQRELVTRPLPPHIGDRAALSGGAVLSNGDIALIVDCDALVRTGTSFAAVTTNAA